MSNPPSRNSKSGSGSGSASASAHSKPSDLEPLDLKGLSFAEMSDKLSSIDSGSPPPEHEEHEGPLNTSDFFNSKGELVLSGLSEWSSGSDCDSDNEIPVEDFQSGYVEEVKSDEENERSGSGGSTASTESITAYRPSISTTSQPPANGHSEHDDLSNKDSINDNSGEKSKMRNKNKFVRFGQSAVNFGGAPMTIPDVANGIPSSEEYYWSEPTQDKDQNEAEDEDSEFRAVVHNIRQAPSVPTYGVRVYPGLHGLNPMNTSATSGWKIIPGTENSEQITSRAPNFRTPGGYRPPLHETPPRNLTAAEITEEVRQMYAEDAEEELESQIIATANKLKDDERRASSSTSTSASDFTTTDGFVKRKPPVKRKLMFKETGAGDGDSAKIDKDKEVVEMPIVKTKGFVCGSGDGHGDLSGDPSTSFDAAPAHSHGGQEQLQYTGDISLCLPRRSRIKNRVEDTPDHGVGISSPDTRKANMAALDKLWRDIQETKQHMETDMKSRMKVHGHDFQFEPNITFQSAPDIPTAFFVNPQPLRSSASSSILETRANGSQSQSESSNPLGGMIRRNSPSKVHRNVNVRRGGKQIPGRSKSKPTVQSRDKNPNTSKEKTTANSKLEQAFHALNIDPSDDIDSFELSSILKEAQIDESELDEILSEINDFPVPGHIFDESEAPEELTSALQQLQISDWAKAGANEYVDKFHEEKYKRQQCEKEILQVQKDLLEQREKIAVLEGLLKSKELAVNKSTNLWEALVKKWKNHEAKCKKTIAGFESEQKELKTELESRKGRLAEYETEMGKSVALTEEFKIQNKKLVEEIEAAAAEKSELMEQIQLSKAERETTMKALTACQSKLDEMKEGLEAANKKVLIAEEKSRDAYKRLENLSKENEKLRGQLYELEKEKTAVELELNEVSQNLKTEKAEKELLETTMKARLESEIQEQGDKLHTYYNEKVHEILKAQSEKMLLAEKEMKKTYEKKFLEFEQSVNTRLQEEKLKFDQEFEALKKENEELRRDNLEKRKFIGAVSRQLQSFENNNGMDELTKSEREKLAAGKATRNGNGNINNVNPRITKPTQDRSRGPLPLPLHLQLNKNHPDPATSEQEQPVPVTPAVSTPNPLIYSASAETKNCIASFVNAYKEKHSLNSNPS